MQSDWNKVIMISTRIFGIVVGLVVSISGMIVLGAEKSLLGWIAMWYLPLLVGGIIAGYFVHSKGWISGLIIAAIFVSSYIDDDLSGKVPLIYILWHIMGLPVGTAGGYLGQLLANNTSTKMRRKVIAVITGTFAAFTLSMILVCLTGDAGKTCSYNGGQFWMKDLIKICFPLFLGGVIVGIIAHRSGWICGLISGLVFYTYVFIILLSMGLGSPIVSALATQGWSRTANTFSTLVLTLAPGWWLYALSLLSGILGGHLGQLLLQRKLKHQEQN
jgi:hypothetical protein